MNPAWTIPAAGLVIIALIALGMAATGMARWLTRRRRDREWFAYIAAKPRGPELLEWLREQRAAVRGHGCVQPIPRADGAELEDWEREEIGRMETFYADDGMDPHSKRRTTGDLS